MVRKLLFILGMITVFAARPQAVSYLICIEVLDGNDVRLRWRSPVDEDTFVLYEIYHATLSNPDEFLLAGQVVNYFDTTFVHTASSAGQQQNLYYVKTVQNALPDILSDTLRTMHLTVNNADPNLARLNWSDPLPTGSGPYFYVFMRNPVNVFSLVDSTTDTQFDIPLAVCRDTFYFRVEMPREGGCTFTSNTASAVFQDITPPPMPMLDSVSIDPYTGEAILGWNQSPAGDAGGYVIYHVRDGINDTLAFIDGQETTFYTDLSFDPCLDNRSYAIAAYDTCNNISPGSYDIPLRTILLQEVLFDPCALSNTLSWSPYINMQPSLQSYRVLLSVNGDPFVLLAELPATEVSFVHEGLQPGNTYRYFIRAFGQGGQPSSSSCIREYTPWPYLQPVSNRLGNVSVNANTSVTVSMLPDTLAYVPFVSLFRSDQASGPFELLATLEPGGSAQINYEDETAGVNSRSYYYRSELTDSCGNEVLPSNLMRTILLSGTKSSSMRNELQWNAFEGWPSGVSGYEVFRALNEDGPLELIAQTAAAELSFEDDISDVSDGLSRLRYRVRALNDSVPGLNSWSNEIVIDYSPALYLPNAFTPGGKNPVFRPLGTFADLREYSFEVYNRWGELLFVSRDFGTGWDGSHKGSPAPAGVYVCVIRYVGAGNEADVLKSTFILIR